MVSWNFGFVFTNLLLKASGSFSQACRSASLGSFSQNAVSTRHSLLAPPRSRVSGRRPSMSEAGGNIRLPRIAVNNNIQTVGSGKMSQEHRANRSRGFVSRAVPGLQRTADGLLAKSTRVSAALRCARDTHQALRRRLRGGSLKLGPARGVDQ